MRFDRASHVCNGKILPLAVGRPQYLAPNFAHKRQHPCVALAFARPPHVCPPPRAAALRTTAFRDACWAMMVSTLSHDVARVEGSRYGVRRTTTLCHRWRTSTLCVHQMSHQLRTRVCGGAHCAARRRLLQESTCERSRVDSRGTQYRGRADSIYERPASNVN